MSVESRRPRRTDQTSKENQPLSVRVNPEERALITTVAEFEGRTVSGFMRDAAINGAIRIIQEVGPEEMIRVLDERQDAQRRASMKVARDLFKRMDEKTTPTE